MAWRTGTHENSNIEAGDLRVRNELRATHFPGSPSRTIWAPFPLLPCTLCKIIIFLAPLPASPTPSARSIPGPEGWNPSTYLSCTHRPKPCFSTLPNFTSSGPPLGIQTWGRLTAPTPSQTLLGMRVLFFWASSPFSVPRPVPLRLLSQRQALWARHGQHLITK